MLVVQQQDEEEAVGGSGSGGSPARRTSSSASAVPPHLRAHEMALSPSSPLHSGAAILIRHRESSGSFSSPARPKLRSEDGGLEEGGFGATVATLAKVCMGTGMLALPYALLRGGLVVGAVGVMLMAAWNYKAVRQLLECRDAVEELVEAEGVDANGLFAFVGLKACGRPGQATVNFCLGATLFGAAISYLVAASDAFVASFPGGDPALTRLLSSALSLAVVLPLSLRPFSFLSYTSVAGLLALGLAFLVLILNGIATLSTEDDDAAAAAEPTPGPWQQAFSTTPRGLAEFYGVVSFCFGIPPLVFPIQGSMTRPDRFPAAVRWSMAAVALLYICICETVALLYPNAPSNILLAMPSDSILATSVRLLVAVVCLLSYPLALVPLAESMGKALVPAHASSDDERAPLRGAGAGTVAPDEGAGRARLAVRVGVVVASAIFASIIPCISIIISFIGAFSVALLALVLPPLFHLRLVSVRQTQKDVVNDVGLLVLGSVATIVATVLTAQAGFLTILFTHKCPK